MSLIPSIGGLVGKGGNTVSGNDTQIQFWGFWHFLISTMGTTVSVQMDGVDCGDFTVAADGSVTVPLLGTTLGGVAGVVSITQLIADDETVDTVSGDAVGAQENTVPIQLTASGATVFIDIPVVIGRAFVTQGQRLRPLQPPDTRTQTGPALAMTSRGHMFGVLVKDAVVASFGSSLTPTPTGDMISCVFGGSTGSTDGSTPLPFAAGYDGVWWETWDCDYSFDTQFCWQVDRPWPFVLIATTGFLETADRTGNP